jgi:hypothetical protein
MRTPLLQEKVQPDVCAEELTFVNPGVKLVQAVSPARRFGLSDGGVSVWLPFHLL